MSDPTPESQSDITKNLEELSKSVKSLLDQQKKLEGTVNSLCSKLQQMAEDQVSNRFCVIGIHTVLLGVLAGCVIKWPVISGSQAAVLCSVVICGSLLGIMYFVTEGRRDEDD